MLDYCLAAVCDADPALIQHLCLLGWCVTPPTPALARCGTVIISLNSIGVDHKLTNGGLAWLAGELAGWLADWLADCLVGWIAGWMANWQDGWLAGRLAEWLTGWLAGWLRG